MKFLVVGLGSMGKRRIRCLKALGYEDIYGFDLRGDRREEVKKLYNIGTFDDFAAAVGSANPDILIISVPPAAHHIYMKEGIKRGIPFFVEASVVDTDMEYIIAEARKKNLTAIPSATLMFHPAIKKAIQLVKDGSLGKVSNLILHVGQYLPDWHPYEKVSEFYVSNPATGGAREIIPFHFTWITQLFGFPKRVCGNCRKTIDIEGAELIDDTYNCLLDYDNFLVTVTVDVVSRYAATRFLINGDKKQLIWDWNDNCIQLYDPERGGWEKIPYEIVQTVPGYNKNIAENMYIEELKDFIDTLEGKATFCNTLEADHKVLKLLQAVEEADKTSKYVRFGA